jgi:tetratricopeptide (TPR) repeat protein
LQQDAKAVVDLIWNEWLIRQQQGQAPQAAEYRRRFGQFDASLQLLFQASRTGVISLPPSELTAVHGLPFPEAGADLPVVPGYEILAELGRGGMAVVYQARQLSLKRLVALKMILAGPHANESTRVRFRNEAEVVAQLQHANIVQIYEVGEHHGTPFLALEYVDGGSLQQKMGNTSQPEKAAAQLVGTLARAMHYTHVRGILHRDLKPSNVLLTSDGIPKITDFGLAKVLTASQGLTRTEALIGTPSYMAPEQAAGNARHVGPPADIYSLGVILYELLTGRVPFQSDTLLNTLDQVRTQEPVPPRRWRGSISHDLQTICLKCLEKAPDRRYPSAEALANDLRHFLDGQPIQARPVAAWERLWRLARRRPALMAVSLGAVALVCALLTAWSYFRVADQLANHRAEGAYQKFVQCRNEALFYGLLAPDQGSMFLDAEPAANLQVAEAAARRALGLVGVQVESQGGAFAPPFPMARKAEVAADCYALLLVLASVRGQRPGPVEAAPERYRQSLRILDRARALGFQTRAYHLRRAYFLTQVGEADEASKERACAENLLPEGALDHFLLGEEQYRRGHGTEAMNSFHRALTLHPGHFWAQFLLAVCHLKSEQWQAAKVGLNACLTQQPDFVWAYLFRSFAHEKLQALAEAESDFERAFQLNPNADARYVLFLTRGILHFNQAELERAAADFQSAMALKPDQYNAYVNLAQVNLARRAFEQAEAQMERALRLKPPVQVIFGYHLERGRNLVRDQKYEDGIKACEAALELSPNQPQPQEVRALAQLALGRHEQAEQSLDLYLQAGGEPLPEVFRRRALARMKLGKYPEAAEDYTRVLERAPEANLYERRGWAHFFADAWKLALRDFAKALELDPRTEDAYTGRGLARVMLGDYREAVADAETALGRKPTTPEMMHNIACIFAQAVARAEAADQQALAQGYRRRALEAVHQTLQMVSAQDRPAFWHNKIRPDTALAPIHHEAEFKLLQRQFGQPRQELRSGGSSQ